MNLFVLISGCIFGYFLSLIIKGVSKHLMLNKNNNISSLYYKTYFKPNLDDIIVILTTVLIFMISNLKLSDGILFYKHIILNCFLIIISFTDIKHHIIPDSLVIIILLTGMVFSIISKSFLNCVLGTFSGGGIMFIIALIPGSIGGGDVKLMAALGAYLGAKGIIYSIMLGFILSSIYSFIILLLKKKGCKDYIPLGPFLCMGTFIAFYFLKL